MATQTFLIRKSENSQDDGHEIEDTYLVLDDVDQSVVLVQAAEEEGEDNDVVILPLAAFDTICRVIAGCMTPEGHLQILEKPIVN